MKGAAAILLAVTLVATPALPAPNAQLVASVQTRLNGIGFGTVDATTLSTRQISALHMQLRHRAPLPGAGYIRTRQKVRVILGWDTPERR